MISDNNIIIKFIKVVIEFSRDPCCDVMVSGRS